MSDVSRRSLIVSVAAMAAPPNLPPVTAKVPLDGRWQFRLDQDWNEVTVPHTWQVEAANVDRRGTARYRREFDVPREWAGSLVRVEFEAVFHSARVRVNDQLVGEHLRKGYTAFTFDLNKYLRFGAGNTIEVEINNEFDEQMLPRGRSSDWAHDGGIYRPVSLLVTPPVFIERVEIDAEPDLAARTATVSVRAILRNTGAAASGRIQARVVGAASVATYRVEANATATINLPAIPVHQPRLWDFDHPNLYTVDVSLDSGHSITETFGIRKIEIRGTGFYLNGQRVRLMGVERMAGSNPGYGMAEPASWIEHDHHDMRNLNCIYTRVHWPQDRRVLDWCDQNGMLIQTEVPAWGPRTFEGMRGDPSDAILTNGLEQLREMIARDRNHPCIFSWGVCNEVNGQNPVAAKFVERLYAESKRLDPKRLVSYASHSLFTTPEKDVAGRLDYIMFNQYFGSWQKGGAADLARTIDSLHAAFPTKPIVVSEYGYCACTPDRPEGDRERIDVLLSQDRVLRDRDWVAGLIFFCYNDYRTHVGDKGRGALRQRVHGVVDLYGNRKPSYDHLRRESSPITTFDVRGDVPSIEVSLRNRDTVPAYTLRGYRVRGVLYGAGNIPLEQVEVAVPDLAPGAAAVAVLRFSEAASGVVKVAVLRPDGSPAIG